MAKAAGTGVHSCVIHPEIKVKAASLGDKYGRMFPDLPACEMDEETVARLGRSRASMDSTLPTVDVALENPRIPAGFAILGQFVAHDITADRSLLADHAEVGDLENFRRPRLDLECLYGDGPVGSPFLYDARDADKMLVGGEEGGRGDLPRNQQGVALVGDPRNDVHLLISQLHVAFLLAHNRAVDLLREHGTSPDRVFEEARRLLRWHYEWILVHEFLPLSAGEETVKDVLENGQRFYEVGGRPTIPVEFADAAYRFGHAQISPVYRLNGQAGGVPIFPDCLGRRAVPSEREIDWSWFFDVPDAGHAPQPSRKIVSSLTHGLMDLPEQIVGHVKVAEHQSLAFRDLQRGHALSLPSGETVARAVGATPLSADECGLGEIGWTAGTPLWYYVLKEAEIRAGGEHLGPVGGRIVTEVLLGLLDADPGSFRAARPDWRPTLPSATPGNFTMGDLIHLSESV